MIFFYYYKNTKSLTQKYLCKTCKYKKTCLYKYGTDNIAKSLYYKNKIQNYI